MSGESPPSAHAARTIVLGMADRLLEMLIEQDCPHSPRGRYAYGVP
ncbi:MAG: hypothetical protein OXG43_07810 [Chloroflexi bacterium]|nr:hypothetical protein [Chloroflexota bacterium]